MGFQLGLGGEILDETVARGNRKRQRPVGILDVGRRPQVGKIVALEKDGRVDWLELGASVFINLGCLC